MDMLTLPEDYLTLPSFAELKIKRKISFPVSYLTRVAEGVNKELDRMLLRYDTDVQGVIVKYNSVKIKEPTGSIIEDLPCIYCNVMLRAVVFRPSVGTRLQGIVHYVGEGHVGLLVYGYFNASIALAHAPGYVCEASNRKTSKKSSAATSWCNPKNIEDTMVVGTVLKFAVIGHSVTVQGSMAEKDTGIIGYDEEFVQSMSNMWGSTPGQTSTAGNQAASGQQKDLEQTPKKTNAIVEDFEVTPVPAAKEIVEEVIDTAQTPAIEVEKKEKHKHKRDKKREISDDVQAQEQAPVSAPIKTEVSAPASAPVVDVKSPEKEHQHKKKKKKSDE